MLKIPFKQNPTVLFQEPNNINFFSIITLLNHQKYIEKNDEVRTCITPLTGDLLELPNGELKPLVFIINGNNFQLTTYPGYHYQSGHFRSYSGGYDFSTEQYWKDIADLEYTGKMKRTKVWSFLEGSAGPSRGITWSVMVPIWKLKS